MIYLLSTCSDYALATTLATVEKIFSVICVVVPILLLISIIMTIIFNIIDPNRKNGLKPIVTKTVSALIIFFIPYLVSLVMSLLVNIVPSTSMAYNVSTCFMEAKNINDKISYNYGSNPTSEIGDDKISNLSSKMVKIKKYKKKFNGNNYSGEVANGNMAIPRYYQGDYSNVILGNNTIANSGCGWTSVAMVMSYLKGTTITPPDVLSWSKSYFVPGAGMSWALPQAACSHYGIDAAFATNDTNKVIQALKNKQPVISSQGPGIFTLRGHIIVLSGITSDGKILVNDPNRSNAVNKGYNNKKFSMSEINASALKYWIYPSKK